MRVSLSATSLPIKFNICDPAPETIELPPFKGILSSGSIPQGVKQLDTSAATLEGIEEGAIPDSVTHLLVRSLNERCLIPPTVLHLFVFDYSDCMLRFVPSTVTHLYMHRADHKQGPNRMHYLFGCMSSIPIRSCENKGYESIEAYQEKLFGRILFIIKRKPKQVLAVTHLIPDVITVGKTYTELVIPDSIKDTIAIPRNFKGLIRPGSIPDSVTNLVLISSEIYELEPRVIPDSVTHLSLRTLTPLITIPPTVKHLAVMDFNSETIKHVPSTVTHLYIHTADRTFAPKDRIHYLFHSIPLPDLDLASLGIDMFDVSMVTDDAPFAHIAIVIKREPKQSINAAQILIEVAKLSAQIVDLKTIIGTVC